MKRIVVAALAALATVCGAKAADRDVALLKFAEVYATAHLCKSLKPDYVMMAVAAKLFDVDIGKGTPDFQVLLALTQDKIAKLSENSEASVCAAGLYLYGPDGESVPGLLVKK